MKNCLLLKYGEIALRGKNRYIFENKLINAIKKNINDSNFNVIKEQGRFIIESINDEANYEDLVPKVVSVMGLVGVCPCVVTKEQDIKNLKSLVVKYITDRYKDNNKKYTFKIETKRSNKSYPLTSHEVSSKIGEEVLKKKPNFKVDVISPQITIFVELRNNAYIYSDMIKGFGGLPVGSSGKAMLLLSGGIDSPVAGFLMQKRGVDIEAIYFHSAPYTSERAKEKVLDLAKQLSSFTGSMRLYVVPFTDIQLMLYNRVQSEKITIFLKRSMIKIADTIAQNIGAHAIVLGDSIGQVASQTMHSIKAVESAATLPIIRPLAGFNKQEIVDISKSINTYNISIKPYEDCCTIFVPKHPETKPKTSVIESIESKLEELQPLIDKAIKNIEVINI